MPEEILELKYLILSTDEKVIIGKEYDVTAGNSSLKEYIVGFRLFEINTIKNMGSIYGITIFNGLEMCYKINLFTRIRLFFGANKKNYSKKEKKNPRINFTSILNRELYL